jgi:hypothetical protein
MGMTEQVMNTPFTERIYALLAYTSATTVLAIGGYFISLAVQNGIMSAPWQIVLAAMAAPVLAATWGIIAPLGIVNPIAWLGALVIIARLYVHTTQQHATGD